MKYSLIFLLLSFIHVTLNAAQAPIGTQPSAEQWQAWTQKMPHAKGYLNGLSMSTSPYLLQHAENPIDWIQWPIPKQQQKLIFLSIGYASCHWCHQMNTHTFMDDSVALILNQHYLSIKVDRDEYPMVDYHYLGIQQAVNGEGGWPISVIALPDGSPVWVGSFENAQNMKNIAQRMARIWQVQPDFLLAQADNIKALTSQQPATSIAQNFDDFLLNSRDPIHFGKQGPVKFPDEGDLLYLLSQYRVNPDLKPALIKHLDALAHSPLHDGVNGGFYRYATQPNWHVPHFEKMLYNQAQLLAIYSKAYTEFQKVVYLNVAQRLFDFLQSNMKNSNGLYKTSINADWHHIEGGYYLWPKSLLDDLNITENIAHIRDDQYQYYGLELPKQLLTEQDKRDKPIEDERGITGLNGLVLWAMVEANNIGIKGADKAAKQLAELLQNRIQQDLSINRVCYDNQHCLDAKIDDHAYLVLGLSAYSSLDKTILPLANNLYQTLIKTLDIQNPFTIDDHESIAPIYAAITSARLLKQAIPFSWLKIPSHALSYHSALKQYQSQFEVANFARDHGRLFKFSHDESITLSLVMESGWHTNSYQPLQDYLIPTQVQGIDPSQVTYPKGHELKVEFDDETLSLYEGITNININKTQVDMSFGIKLQACSDSLCLPPEVFEKL